MASITKLRRARGPLRSNFARLIGEIKQEANAENINLEMIEARFDRLSDLREKISTIDQQISDGMLDAECSEEEYNRECDSVESYLEEWSEVKVRVKKLLTVTQTGAHRTTEAAVDEVGNCGQRHRDYKLPKIEIQKFDGNLTGWIGFWAQFKKIHDDSTIDETDKFQYLVQSLKEGTRAKRLVESYPMSGENYNKVLKALQDRFGDPVLLTEIYVRKLLSLVIANTSQPEKTSLVNIFDGIQSHLRALESLGVTTQQSASFLYPLVESSLPEEVLQVWQRSPSSGYGEEEEEVGNEEAVGEERPIINRLERLMKFLRQEVKGLERLSFVREGLDSISISKKYNVCRQVKKSSNGDKQIPATAAELFNGKEDKHCVFCEKSHLSQECIVAQKMSLEKRLNRIKEQGRCFSCLRPGHRSKTCKIRVQCLLCKKRHYPVICRQLDQDNSRSKEEVKLAANANQICTSSVLLKTIVVRIVGQKSSKLVRLVFDDGNQQSYLKKDLGKNLGMRPISRETVRHSLFGGRRSSYEKHNQYKIIVESLNGKCRKEILVLDQSQICGLLPRVSSGPWMEELEQQEIILSDQASVSPDIAVLIGSDYWGQCLTGKIYQTTQGLTAVETIFGWTLSGKVPGQSRKNVSMLVTSMLVYEMVPKQLWDLETIGIKDQVEQKDKRVREEEVWEHFVKTVSRNEDGCYIVRLPWNSDRKILTNNRGVAEQRLRTLTVKLKKQGGLQDYNEVFNQWIQEDLIEECDFEREGQSCHYLPHRAIYRPESKTTPIRPVFDASCKIGPYPSLNECLEKGPNLLELIPNIMFRFREKQIGVTADIRKAFMMIEIQQEDREYLRFLWWKSINHDSAVLTVYRHKRVVFGVNCSPFLLAAVIRHHLNNTKVQDKAWAEKIQQSFYVDNCVTSVQDMEEYEEFKGKAVHLLAEAKMELRQWEHSYQKNEERFAKVLGMKWDKVTDTLGFVIDEEKPIGKLTKREILSRIQKIFDPLGFLVPVMVRAKLTIQRAWATNHSWDGELEDNLKEEFTEWWKNISQIKEVRIPRWIFTYASNKSIYQLHIFCDASQYAYAAAVYLRTKTEWKTKVSLLIAKTRVAPLKKITIPRLELLACTIGARLAASVKESLTMRIDRVCYWTDSTVVLAWIKRNDQWGTFVGNRLKEICSLSNPEEWTHVPGEKNPADLPSRGCTVRQFLQLSWWEGPGWLREEEEMWPAEGPVVDEDLVRSEQRRTVMVSTVIQVKESPWYVMCSSRLWHNVRVMAWILRAVAKFRGQCNFKGDLLYEEVEAAEEKIINLVQGEEFEDRKELINGLQAFKDEKGLLRVKSRLVAEERDKAFRQPILLPKNHLFVDQLIRHEHFLNGHVGGQVLLSKLRERFWILQGRRAVRRVVNSCVVCRRFAANRLTSAPAPLPEDRVKLSGAFECTGVDLAGPLFLKNGNKTWIVLFTYAVYRAIHVELVTSLSTEDFLMTFSRFISRRGRPKTMYSDNGSNFVGAVNLFRRLNWNQIEQRTAIYQVKLKFNPPTAAWWGGWWERLIRLVKDLLKKMLGHGKLSFQLLETALCQVESAVNARPLTYLSEDIEDLIPLTPAMFIQDLYESECPELQLVGAEKLRHKYRELSQLHKELRARFRKEYLSHLMMRGKLKQDIVTVGDVVLVEMNNKKKLDWSMARVVELLPGKDGRTRVVRLKTANGELIRPIQRLYPLEVPTVEVLQKEISPGQPVREKFSRRSGCGKEQKLIDDKKRMVLDVTRSGRRVKTIERLKY